jgi:SAM-dependent methyltransferase
VTSVINRLGELYSANIASIAAEIVTFIDGGDYAVARKSIAALAGDDKILVHHHMLSLLEFKQGRFAEAEAALNFCIGKGPDLYISEYCQTMLEWNRQDVALGILGGQQRNNDRHAAILAAVERLIERNPGQGLLPFRDIGINILIGAARYSEALKASIDLPDSRLSTIANVLAGFAQARRLGEREPISSTQSLERELVRIIEDDVLNLQLLRKVFADILTEKFSGWQRASAPLSVISLDPLLQALMLQTELFSKESEIHLTKLRQRLLQETVARRGRTVPFIDLIFAMLVQCEKNEYAYYRKQAELESLAQLDAEIEELLKTPQADACALVIPLMLTLMYRSPADIEHDFSAFEDTLAAEYPPLAEFRSKMRESFGRETALAKAFAEENLGDDTSAKVAGMYEQNPYPRWTGAPPDINPTGQSVVQLYGLDATPAWNAGYEPTIRSVLVAGCGTGLHPIPIALGYPDVEVTAVDITCRSLAYAQTKADELEVKNISFLRRDILKLSEWDMQFDMVESVGVIHHMLDPEAGLQGLLSVLRPQGLLKLGVYSQSARADVIRFRKNNAPRLAALRPDDIRQIRHEILEGAGNGEYDDLLFTPDFFTMSGCRDLMLHEQEMQFTLEQLMLMLERNGLRFLKFQPQGNIYQQLDTILGPGTDSYDWRSWERAEEKFPSLFAGMYTIFAQRIN